MNMIRAAVGLRASWACRGRRERVEMMGKCMILKQSWVLLLIVGAAISVPAGLRAGDVADPVRQGPRVLSAKERNIGRLVPDVEVVDITGGQHRLSDLAKEQGLLIAVTSTSCPLSLKYLPSLVEAAGPYPAEPPPAPSASAFLA